MASGEKDLHILNDGADYLLPSGIQFAHDIIQQQNGRCLIAFCIQCRLREAESQC